MATRVFKTTALSTGIAIALGSAAPTFAQEDKIEEIAQKDVIEEVFVTGSRIKGAQINDVLPVTVMDATDIELVNVSSGDELFRSIPQVGSVNFNVNDTTGGINSARGDVASINLRDLGTGNTLMLVNGRRMVLTPGFQTELLVPVVSPDTNTLPPGGIRRIEVLRDGGSAIYGADAVAGVINTFLKDQVDGGFIRGDFQDSEGTNLYNTSIRGAVGSDFNEGRSNVTLHGYYFHENGLPATARSFSRSSDRRPLVVGTAFEGDTQFDDTSTSTPWASVQIQGPDARSSGTTRLGDDDFHIQPCSNFGETGAPADGRFLDLGSGLCADNGTLIDRELRYNVDGDRDLFSEKDRYNFYALVSHTFSDAAEFYFEGSYYRSKSRVDREPGALLTAVPIGVLSTAFYNPLGATTLADGSPNPNRITDGLGSGVGPEGRDLLLTRYRPVDTGRREGTVTSETYRTVAGFRGEIAGWDYDTGFVYSEAETVDWTRNRVSMTALQDAINRTDETAYNPFDGGCFLTETTVPNSGDCTPSNAAALEAARIDVFRKGETTLALADFKVSKPDLFQLPAGSIGIAAGVEFRRETFKDIRDPRLNGTITFTNAVNGEFFGSDVVQQSPSPNTSGNREIYSAHAEAFIPLVSENMDIPLIRSFNVQLAGRFEDFSDVGSTFVPRAAASWDVFDGVMLRGAWSEGFRAPNLVQINDEGTTRVNGREDFTVCQAQIIKGIIEDFDACPALGTVSFRSGARDLEPEETESINLGVVLSPTFLPALTLTVDFWRIDQDGIVGVFGDANALALDLVRRLGGSSNPNVIRRAPDEGQIDLFAGTGLEPAGDVIRVLDPFLNQDSRRSKGWDFGMFYDLGETLIGEVSLKANAARLTSSFQTPGADGQELLDATASGALPSDITINNIGEQLELNGRPKWRLNFSANVRNGPYEFSLFGNYVGSVFDTSVTQDETGEFFRTKSVLVINAGVSYRFKKNTIGEGIRIRFGINNLFDKKPPLADESFGFFGRLHSARDRFYTLQIQKDF